MLEALAKPPSSRSPVHRSAYDKNNATDARLVPAWLPLLLARDDATGKSFGFAKYGVRNYFVNRIMRGNSSALLTKYCNVICSYVIKKQKNVRLAKKFHIKSKRCKQNLYRELAFFGAV